MTRHPLFAILACTVALLLPACDPPDDPDPSIGGPEDFSDEPDEPDEPDESEDEPEPRPKPHRPERVSDGPRDQSALPADDDRTDAVRDASRGRAPERSAR